MPDYLPFVDVVVAFPAAAAALIVALLAVLIALLWWWIRRMVRDSDEERAEMQLHLKSQDGLLAGIKQAIHDENTQTRAAMHSIDIRVAKLEEWRAFRDTTKGPH